MGKETKAPRSGEVWWVDLEPVRGREQGRRRPCLVVSVDEFNGIPHGLAWVLPITSNLLGNSFTVEIRPPEGGVKTASMVLCHQLRTISVDRMERRGGAVSDKTMGAVKMRIGLILGLGTEPL